MRRADTRIVNMNHRARAHLVRRPPVTVLRYNCIPGDGTRPDTRLRGLAANTVTVVF